MSVGEVFLPFAGEKEVGHSQTILQIGDSSVPDPSTVVAREAFHPLRATKVIISISIFVMSVMPAQIPQTGVNLREIHNQLTRSLSRLDNLVEYAPRTLQILPSDLHIPR